MFVRWMTCCENSLMDSLKVFKEREKRNIWREKTNEWYKQLTPQKGNPPKTA